jgi:hypothetical protein
MVYSRVNTLHDLGLEQINMSSYNNQSWKMEIARFKELCETFNFQMPFIVRIFHGGKRNMNFEDLINGYRSFSSDSFL